MLSFLLFHFIVKIIKRTHACVCTWVRKLTRQVIWFIINICNGLSVQIFILEILQCVRCNKYFAPHAEPEHFISRKQRVDHVLRIHDRNFLCATPIFPNIASDLLVKKRTTLETVSSWSRKLASRLHQPTTKLILIVRSLRHIVPFLRSKYIIVTNLWKRYSNCHFSTCHRSNDNCKSREKKKMRFDYMLAHVCTCVINTYWNKFSKCFIRWKHSAGKSRIVSRWNKVKYVLLYLCTCTKYEHIGLSR